MASVWSAAVETLLVTRDGGVVTVTLNRPEKKNAANGTMWGELLAVFDEVADRQDDRVLVITGAGDAFCSGADLSDAGRAGDDTHQLQRMRRIGDAALRLHRLPKPTIAKVNGVAVGAGCNLALGCDLVVASDRARFSEIFARRGLSIDFGGSWLLPRLVGLHKAKELALLAEIVGADEAERIGIVNRVVPHDDLDAFVDDWARRLAAGPPLALSMTKTMLNSAMAVSMEQALEDEARCQSVNSASADTAEAMAAFLQKRDPSFQGR
jgi:enoyl-CoA hydratase/carnithine racemase